MEIMKCLPETKQGIKLRENIVLNKEKCGINLISYMAVNDRQFTYEEET